MDRTRSSKCVWRLAVVPALCCLSWAWATPPIDPNEARPHVDWTQADKVVGKVAFVSGRIVSVGSSGRVNFLNFEQDRPARFTGIVFQTYVGNFPDSLKNLYEGKYVRIRGMVTTYAGKPQIQITSPDQIEVLAEPVPVKPLAEPRRHPVGSEITLATFNILNLFDDVDDPYRNDESTRTKPRSELEDVAKTIRKLDADVLALEEVENRGYLRRFVEVFLSDMGYEHVVHYEGNDVRGIDACLLSRVPVGPVTSYRHVRFKDEADRTMSFRRDVVAVELHPPHGEPFEVWVVHLKSNSGGREHAEPVRMGEAKELRRMLDERLGEDPKARIVVCGDFNDTWDSEALKTIVGTGSKAMRCAVDELPEEKRITYNREPYRSMIDFILMSPAMGEEYVKGSYRIHHGSVETLGSDHNPVSARFDLK
jgi:endonuclease/exonuclease/phosphatase family metal-dependent hydrolase